MFALLALFGADTPAEFKHSSRRCRKYQSWGENIPQDNSVSFDSQHYTDTGWLLAARNIMGIFHFYCEPLPSFRTLINIFCLEYFTMPK